MIARELSPGVVVFVTEDDAWRELLLGEQPQLPSDDDVIWVGPENQKLSLVDELAIHAL